MASWNFHLSGPSNFRCLFWFLSAAETTAVPEISVDPLLPGHREKRDEE